MVLASLLVPSTSMLLVGGLSKLAAGVSPTPGVVTLLPSAVLAVVDELESDPPSCMDESEELWYRKE